MATKPKDNSELRAMGARLTAARLAAGYAEPIDFHQAFEISQSSYSHYESGSRALSRERAREFAGHLGNVSAGWLLTGEGEPPKQLPPKPSLGKRGALVEGRQTEEPGDITEHDRTELLRVWSTLPERLRVAALTLIRAAIPPEDKIG